MGKLRPVKQAKLFTGIIAADEKTLARAEKLVEEKIGKISLRSAVIPFAHTDYYKDEMGGGLLRRWVGFEKTVPPSELAKVKLLTNGIEDGFAADGKRKVNLDPGYLELAKVVLASTKDFGHRIYIGDGIYAELTLMYNKGEGYKALPWTYPDYQCSEAVKFLDALRKQLKDVIDISLPK
jgi:hypothetical protein